MKILYHSAAPWVSTGYGRCTKEVVPRLQDMGYEVAIQCMDAVKKNTIKWRGDSLDRELEEPIEVYPANSPFGLNDVADAFDDSGADLLFTHFDTWMEPARKTIPEMDIPYASWAIVDHSPVPEAVVEQVNNARDVAAMSKWAERELREKGTISTYIPHGVDTSSFHPIENESGETPTSIRVRDEQENTKEISLEDNYVVGMVAANHGDRKNIPSQMEAYKKFLDRVDENAIMYIHTDPSAQNGFDLNQVRKEIGIPKDKILWPSNEDYRDVGDEFLNSWYNAFDVLLNCSYGESWGLAITEAQSVGTPCIVTDFSSMPEQLGADLSKGADEDYWSATIRGSVAKNVHEVSHGLVVEPSTGVFRQKVSAKQYICDPEDIFRALKHYFDNPEKREAHGEKAAEFVRDNYTWDGDVIPRMDNMFKRIGKTL